MEATLKATGQIGKAVAGCTIMLIISFMPLVFLPEGAGDFIRGLPMAVILSVFASMLVSLTIIPFLSSRLLKNHMITGRKYFHARPEKNSYTEVMPVCWTESLNRPVFTIAVAVIHLASQSIYFNIIGFALFPSSEKPQFLDQYNHTAPVQYSVSPTTSHEI